MTGNRRAGIIIAMGVAGALALSQAGCGKAAIPAGDFCYQGRCSEEPDYKGFGFRRAEGGAPFAQSRAILVGNTHEKHDSEVSGLLEGMARDGDTILLEGHERGKVLDNLIGECDEEFIYPYLWGIRNAGTRVRVRGADDTEKRDMAAGMVRQFIRDVDAMRAGKLDNDGLARISIAKHQIDGLNRERDYVFCQEIASTPGRAFMVVGSEHIRESGLRDCLRDAGVPYTALVPLEDRSSVEHSRKYFGAGQATAAPRNIVIDIDAPEGRKSLGYAWFGRGGRTFTFEEAEGIRPGDEIEFVGTDNANDRAIYLPMGIEVGRKYRVLGTVKRN
jgi:hypothetical protein